MNKIIVIALTALLGLGFVGFIVFAKESKKTTSTETSDKAVTIEKTGMFKGSENSPVTLVEFADFQCPYCATAYPILEEVLKEYDGKVRFNYKHFPLISIHRNAVPAATAAEAAGLQGKFWEMYSLLYSRQQDWSNEPSAGKKFEEYASELDLDVEKFKSDMTSDALAKKIDDQRNEGISLGVNSTPTFFLNGKRIELESLSIEEFRKLFDAELAKGAPTQESSASTPSAETIVTPTE